MQKQFGRRDVLRGVGALGLVAAGGFSGSNTAVAATTEDEPQIEVLTNEPDTQGGVIFYTYTIGAGGGGLALASAAGDPLWHTTATGHRFQNFQLQYYQDQYVYTWWQGTGGAAGGGTGSGKGVITDLDHAAVAEVTESDGYYPDGHEFRLTPAGTALLTSYVTVPADLSSVGGPTEGEVLNSYVEEVDIATGEVLLRWSALDHVPLTDSYVPPREGRAYDYFHVNSISLAPDGNIIVSGRQTCALYKLDRSTGDVLWRLGGKNSSFTLAEEAKFSYQHNAVYDGADIRIFDNGSNGAKDEPNQHATRVAWLHLDTATMTASLTRSMGIDGLQTDAMGNAQRLANGNVFVNWGMNARVSEFSPTGELLFDAQLPTRAYRAYKSINPVLLESLGL